MAAIRIEEHLEEIASRAFTTTLGLSEPAPAMLKPAADPTFGDYQCNGAMALGKRLKRAPKEVAAEVAAALAALPEFASAEVAGPGFINLRLDAGWIAAQLTAALADERNGVPEARKKERIVVDYSSPNIAKQMHVGHLRSTIIGASIVAMLRFLGHEVIGDNHLGDWGTQFGLLIVGMRTWGSEEALDKDAISELERVYQLANAKAAEDEAFAESARAELAKLQKGDPDNRALWERFVAATRVKLDEVYSLLGVQFEEWLGESAYDAALPGVVDQLLQKGIAVEDQGAIGVFFNRLPNAPKDLAKREEPYIIRKKDGAFLYATSDIATIEHRRDKMKADRAVYVVDSRQAFHFKQLFAVAMLIGVDTKLEHVGFGTVLGEDGKPLKARAGKAVTLASLLAEAIERAIKVMEAEGVVVDDMDVASRAVGVGAVKYADLRQNRLSDYQFDWDKMISFKGNCGPYLQYAYARNRSILRKSGDENPRGPIVLEAPEEIALARTLLPFADVVHRAADTYQPHLICEHLHTMARAFSTFYEACNVLKSEGPVLASRLALVSLTSRQLKRGLGLLGLEVLERM
jgi:arginyl-tRNA synthetase